MFKIVTALAIASAFTAVNAATIKYDGRTYILVTNTMSWADAEYNCVERFKGHLVSFHNATQMSAVYNGVGATGSPWIGLTDQVTEQTWVWSDHSPLDFQAWAPGEPNNWGSGENCAESTATAWNDANCDTPQTSICVEDTNNSVDQKTNSLLNDLLDNAVKSSHVNDRNSSSDGATGVIVLVTLLGAIAIVVGVGYTAFKKKRMAMDIDRTALIEGKMSSSGPDVDMQSYGAASTV